MSSADKRYQVIVSEKAAEMIVQHTRFLARVSEQAAEKLRIDIIEAAESLQEYPERGFWLTDPILPVNKYRKILVDKRYLLIYLIKNGIAYIDYVVDCRQDYGWLII